MEQHPDLGKRLAHTEKKIRDKAVKLVERWLKSKQDLSEIDLLKLWKALYYCIWMSDKPVIQLELATRLSKMTHIFKTPELQLLFVRTFWNTMTREWTHLDKFRMDKMYSLMRLFVTESLTLLKQSDWDEELLARYNAIMKEYIFDANPTTRRNGIMLHVADVFIAELSKVEPNYYSTLSSGVLLALLEPFFYFGVHSDNVAFTNRVEEDVFEAMQNQWTEIIASLPAGAPETKTMEHHIERICENLYHYASTKETPNKNRTFFYDVHKSLSKAFLSESKKRKSATEEEQPTQKSPQTSNKKAKLVENAKTSPLQTKADKKKPVAVPEPVEEDEEAEDDDYAPENDSEEENEQLRDALFVQEMDVDSADEGDDDDEEENGNLSYEDNSDDDDFVPHQEDNLPAPSTPKHMSIASRSPTSSAKKRVQFNMDRNLVQEYNVREKPLEVNMSPSTALDLSKQPGKGLLKVKGSPVPALRLSIESEPKAKKVTRPQAPTHLPALVAAVKKRKKILKLKRMAGHL